MWFAGTRQVHGFVAEYESSVPYLLNGGQYMLEGESPDCEQAVANLSFVRSIAGIGFVGLVILHIVRLHVGGDLRRLLPLSALVDQLPISLQTAALSVPLRKADHQRLVDAVNTPLKDAMGWA